MTAQLDHFRSIHTVMFTLEPTETWSITDEGDVTVTPNEITVVWAKDLDAEEWRLLRADVYGRRILSTGKTGGNRVISMWDLTRFPADVAAQINDRGPK